MVLYSSIPSTPKPKLKSQSDICHIGSKSVQPLLLLFRTADSIPAEVVDRWRQELAEWLRIQKLPVQLADFVLAHRTDHYYKLFEQLSTLQQRDYKRLSDRLFHRSLDKCHGACLLRRPELAKLVGDAIKFYDSKKYDLDRRASRRYSQNTNPKPCTPFGCPRSVFSKSQMYFGLAG